MEVNCIESSNWIVQNLTNSLNIWNDKLDEIWRLLTITPSEFKNGKVWNIILNIHGALQSVGYALLVLFFVVGLVKTCGSFAEVKKPEKVVKMFVRFALSKAVITYGLDLMLSLTEISQGLISKIMGASGIVGASPTSLPNELVDAIESCSFWESVPLWAVTLIGCLIITALSFILVLTVYGRFFKIYMYTAIAPIPLSTFAGETTQNTGKQFLKSYCAVLLEGAIIILSCVIFSAFSSSPPITLENVSAVTMVWTYLGELLFNMLVLVGCVKASDRIIKEIMGL